ncbi:hypothetical protein [Escherichia coli]|uniref:hypothetical protein n=1 Tax=Escherichia coli TaxID=562 RepID=UPI003D6E6130
MNSEPNKQCCNRADEVKKESQSSNKDDELAQLLANLEITDSALYLSNERIEEIASTDSDAEKRQLAGRLLNLQRYRDNTSVLHTLSFKHQPGCYPLNPLDDRLLNKLSEFQGRSISLDGGDDNAS